jgi:hypothetical protein
MIQFYKPNRKNTGTACSFWRKSNDNSFWVSMIKQHSWNSNTNQGSFSENKNDDKKRVIVKLNEIELSGVVDAIERNAEYSGYHSSQKQIVKFKFGPYKNKDGDQLGFSFSVNKEDKEDSTNKQSYLIGFYFPEGRYLKAYIEHMLSEGFHNPVNKYKKSAKKTPDSKEGELSQEEDYDF